MGELDITCPDGADTEAGASRSGDFPIQWSGPEGAIYRLIEHAGPPVTQTTLYEGSQKASTVTGRPRGDYRYQVGIVRDGDVVQWSSTCEVQVRPYPLAMAFTFFGLGLVVTLATVLVVLLGHRVHKRETSR